MYDSMAIKGDQVDKMKNAIEKYTVKVEENIKKLQKFKIDDSTGFYGTAQAEKVDTYIDQTCAEINKIVRYFDDFQTKLNEVKEAYEAQDTKITTGEVEAAKEADASDLVTVNRMN